MFDAAQSSSFSQLLRLSKDSPLSGNWVCHHGGRYILFSRRITTQMIRKVSNFELSLYTVVAWRKQGLLRLHLGANNCVSDLESGIDLGSSILVS